VPALPATVSGGLMNHAIVRIFDVYDHAQGARDALLAEGISPDLVSMSVANDEAGPVEGNFTVGNSPVESDYHTYDRNYAKPSQPNQCLVTVAATDAAVAARAATIMARFGARDPDPAAHYLR
jgi:hypothetical protein